MYGGQIMITIIAGVYGVGVVLAIVGVFMYRSKIKNSNPQSTYTQEENTGIPLSGGVEHLKIICK